MTESETNGVKVLSLEKKLLQVEAYSKSLEDRLTEYASLPEQLASLQAQFQDFLKQKANPRPRTRQEATPATTKPVAPMKLPV